MMSEFGEICIPAELRQEMRLQPGQMLVWQRISSTECRVIVPARPKGKADLVAALSFAERHGLETMPTDEFMKILREGEQD